MQNHMARSEHDACIGVGLECLALLGIKLGRQPADEEVVAEITALRDALRDRTADEILGQPRMTAPPMLAAMGVMAVMYASTFYTDPNLNDLLVCQMVRLSLLHGNAEPTGIGYVPRQGALPEARRVPGRRPDRQGGLRADREDERARLQARGGQPLWLSDLGLDAPHRHRDRLPAREHPGRERGREPDVGSFSNIQLTLNVIVRGDPIEEAYKVAVSALDYATKAKITFAADAVTSMLRLVQAMRGATRHLGTMSADDFDEQAFEDRLGEGELPERAARPLRDEDRAAPPGLQPRRGGPGRGEGGAQHLGGQRDVVLGRVPLLRRPRPGGPLLRGPGRGAGRAPAVARRPRGAAARLGRELPRQLRRQTRARWRQARASTARHDEAAALYDKAIVAFRESRFIHQEALASENLAARFYLDRGCSGLPGLYLREAVASYCAGARARR